MLNENEDEAQCQLNKVPGGGVASRVAKTSLARALVNWRGTQQCQHSQARGDSLAVRRCKVMFDGGYHTLRCFSASLLIYISSPTPSI